jgi:hypothetical protein
MEPAGGPRQPSPQLGGHAPLAAAATAALAVQPPQLGAAPPQLLLHPQQAPAPASLLATGWPDPSRAAAAAPSPPPGGAPPAPRQPLPKQITAAIKSATSVDRLSRLFYDHADLLNPIHVAAMITKLPKLEACVGVSHLGAAGLELPPGAPGLPWLPPSLSSSRELLAALLQKLRGQELSEYGPRGLANIVWALAKLQHYPDPELRALLLDTFIARLPQAVPQVRGPPS